VAAAADELGVTRAAIGAQIRGLEERLGRPLFRRTPGGLVPEDALAAQGERLSAGFAELAVVDRALSSRASERHVALTVSQTFAETWLPRHLPTLFARQGQVDLRLDTSWEVVDLRRSDVHFAIRFMGEADDDHACADLLPSGVVPVCTPDFAERYGLSPGLRSLDGVPIVRMDVPTSDPEWLDWAGWSRATGIALGAPAAAAQVALLASGSRIAKAGIGLVLGGMSEVVDAVAAGELILPFGPGSAIPASYWHRLVWLKSRRLGPAQRTLRDWILERAAEDRALMGSVFGA
jgi:DNA-binding transcriptional LysR family regulator